MSERLAEHTDHLSYVGGLQHIKAHHARASTFLVRPDQLRLPEAYAVARWISTLFFGVTAGDVITLSSACLLLVAAAIVATAYPAGQAMSVDPAVALRTESRHDPRIQRNFRGERPVDVSATPECRVDYGFLAWSENAAPCGSLAVTTQSPPGTSIGPFRISPPLALIRSTAALMSGTLK